MIISAIKRLIFHFLSNDAHVQENMTIKKKEEKESENKNEKIFTFFDYVRHDVLQF